MAHDVFGILDELENRGAGRQYSITQPQFRVPSRPVPPRDRYRAHRDTVYDIPEDIDTYEQEMPFDSFDEELMHQPVQDRQTQAAQGRARLSLAPQASKYLSTGASSHSQLALRGRPDREHAPVDDDRDRSRPGVPDLSRFTFTASEQQESSSDPQIGASSSPAFRAAQRRSGDQHHHIDPLMSNNRYEREEDDTRSEARHQKQPTPSQTPVSHRPVPNQIALSHASPMAQGIPLVSRSVLPDRLRSVFPFDFFNAVQSKCFQQVYRSDDNFVLSSPTGSGKTAILELAICRAISTNATGQYKIVYQAPTKALCSERQRDWHKKFNSLGLQCVELTGDSDAANLKSVQRANIIVTTPEKWDSITRKWKDHEKLIRLIKLFLIDEVHILNGDRGATLETVVSRMKTIGTDVRFVALSATVPNFGDVAAWLGKNARRPEEPANNEKFGEEFRPVKLKKHVCGYQSNGNDFQLDKLLDGKLPEVISKYSERKPIMVFCVSRASTVATANFLADWWISRTPQDQYWKQPSKALQFRDSDLRNCAASGVAFHHAGLETIDRLGVEGGFLKGDISVICCTSTLAVGVNLPCHFVIIKNTVVYSNAGLKEYADLEIMQMLGRAGRPQFDSSAVAVIMTRQQKVRQYELMVTGQDILESCLHQNLIDHLNAEVGLGTIRDLPSAKRWLAGTFLYVRMKQNPAYYKLEGARSGQGIDEHLDDICSRDIKLLQDTNLVTSDRRFTCTDFGDAMARYCVQFGTMRVFMGLEPKAKISEILSALAQAAEFNELRFRAGEKSFYKTINQSPAIRFPIPVNLDRTPQKVSLILQSVLGGAETPSDDGSQKIKTQYTMEINLVFKHIHRLIRCIIDCQICLGDSVAVRNALMLERSLGARAWDDSALQMRQVSGIGPVAVRKFVNAGIRNMEELENTEAHRIQMIQGKNPPFGMKLLDQLKSFPKLRVSVHVPPTSISKVTDGVKITVKAEIGFLNESPPPQFQGKPIYVCLLAETSDGRLINFARTSGAKLGNGQDLFFPALLTAPDQCIICYIMCDGFAGTMRAATIKPNIPASRFPVQSQPRSSPERPTSNMSRRRLENASVRRSSGATEDFDEGIDDEDLVNASFADLDFDHIENYANPNDAITRKNTAKNTTRRASLKAEEKPIAEVHDEPKRLDNGKWACNHKCKDKNACKHMCCRTGLDKPPKKAIKRTPATEEVPSQAEPKKKADMPDKTQTKLQLTASKRKGSAVIEVLDLTQQERKRKMEYAKNGPKDYRELHQLHQNIQKKEVPRSVTSVMHKKPAYNYSAGGEHNLSFLGNDSARTQTGVSSDYSDFELSDVLTDFDPPPAKRVHSGPRRLSDEKEAKRTKDDPSKDIPLDDMSDLFGDDDSTLGEVMVGLADSENLQVGNKGHEVDTGATNVGYDDEYHYEDFSANVDTPPRPLLFASPSSVQAPKIAPEKRHSLFCNDTSSPQPAYDGFRSAKSVVEGPVLKQLKQGEAARRKTRTKSTNYSLELNEKENDTFACEVMADANDHAPIGDVQRTILEDSKNNHVNEVSKVIPDALKDLDPWLYAEFGDIVEIVDE
ncbi:Sec63 Brl domain-domain-containing protein [Clohesyomyces aquaticus]|uniref:DNA 3'-5' helicase n=1 Tax=Clohesyomyces aquaticus TaxID=1231657 RepID=A0A1Y1ZRK9_9PLEO|nr:Sec63 Brl domain-domain-containing protein [Clohesyomyces aquaticus]